MNSIYDDVNNEAWATWVAERPEPYDPGDQEPDPHPTPQHTIDTAREAARTWAKQQQGGS